MHLPPFSLCYDHPKKAIVLSIRGSMSLRVSLAVKPYQSCSVHVIPVGCSDGHEHVNEVSEGGSHVVQEPFHQSSRSKCILLIRTSCSC